MHAQARTLYTLESSANCDKSKPKPFARAEAIKNYS